MTIDPTKFNPMTNAINALYQRLKDYEIDPNIVREELIKTWQKYHPEAVKEKSQWLKPLILLQKNNKFNSSLSPEIPQEAQEIWHNDVYQVTYRKYKKDPVFNSSEGMIQLGISSLDGTARHDWRDFQAIKNQLAGLECEAFELYPAESRLLDPSNYYSLWCFPGIKKIKIGKELKHVLDQNEAISPQRAFTKEKNNET